MTVQTVLYALSVATTQIEILLNQKGDDEKWSRLYTRRRRQVHRFMRFLEQELRYYMPRNSLGCHKQSEIEHA